MMVLTQFMGVVQTWFLGFWSSQYEMPGKVHVAFYLGIYGASFLLLFILPSHLHCEKWSCCFLSSFWTPVPLEYISPVLSEDLEGFINNLQKWFLERQSGGFIHRRLWSTTLMFPVDGSTKLPLLVSLLVLHKISMLVSCFFFKYSDNTQHSVRSWYVHSWMGQIVSWPDFEANTQACCDRHLIPDILRSRGSSCRSWIYLRPDILEISDVS